MAAGPTRGSHSGGTVDGAVTAWKQEWTAFHGDPDVVLQHYTTAEGLDGILSSQLLRASHASYLNDATELSHARRVVRDVLQAGLTTTKSDVGGQFLNDWLQLLDSSVTEPEVYVTCFCVAEDLLSQWRGYAGGTGGYAIGFHTPLWLESGAAPVILRKIVYQPGEQQGWINSLIGPAIDHLERLAGDEGTDVAIASIPNSLDMCEEAISECLFCFKHEKFEEEEEWRIVYRPDVAGGSAKHPARLFRAKGGLLVPYVELELKSSHADYAGRLPIWSVTVGPSAHPELATKSVVMLLRERGYPDSNVLSSEIPLRA